MISEFEIIRRYFDRPSRTARLGVGDDAALLALAAGMELAVSTDMLVAEHHFRTDDDPWLLGRKALAVNLSDLAAMGATPRWATLALAIPSADERWLEGFAGGFFEMAGEHHVELVGGDTTRGPLTLCVQVMGEVPAGRALRRGGALAGDDIWVSGTLGDAALGLAHAADRIRLEPREAAGCLARLHDPAPRVELGRALLSLARSAIDVSDGLLADLGHILERSRVGATIEFAAIPRSPTLDRHLASPEARRALLGGGDDYELVFSAPASLREAVREAAGALHVAVAVIGRIEAQAGLRLTGPGGEPMVPEATGFDHFR